MNPSPLFSLKNVSYSYEDSTLALDNISLDIFSGECVALLGSNGSGKSTLLKLLDGLYFPTSGTLTAFDRLFSETFFRDEKFNFLFRSKVGFVFQESDAQLFLPTVKDELAFAPLQMNLPLDEVRVRVEKALQALDIASLSERAPHQLSGGEKKKVALASLLTLEPEIWLLDEPTAGLDPRTVSWLIDFIHAQSAAGRTVVIATHDLELVESTAERVHVLDEQHRIVTGGNTAEILADRDLLRRVDLIR